MRLSILNPGYLATALRRFSIAAMVLVEKPHGRSLLGALLDLGYHVHI